MFHDSGAKLPGYVRMRTPEQVADGVLRAIERNRLEVVVAPLSLRVASAFAGLAPSVTGALQRRLGSREMAAEVVKGQLDKR